MCRWDALAVSQVAGSAHMLLKAQGSVKPLYNIYAMLRDSGFRKKGHEQLA